MSRLLIHVEGETEENFVNEILAPYLYQHGFSLVGARLIGNARQRDQRGGIKPWHSVRKDIVNHLKADQMCVATTMVDYYGLPQNGSRAWPGRQTAANRDFPLRAKEVEDALMEDIVQNMEKNFDRNRFIPYVAMHEYEALLFSDCSRFSSGIGHKNLESEFQKIRNDFSTPEEIDDSPKTAPSKRIQALVPGYQKPFLGTLAALEIGLPTMQAACPHFAAWLNRLEEVGNVFCSKP